MAIRKIALGLVVILLASIAWGQHQHTVTPSSIGYVTNYTYAFQDITSYATSGTNAWWPFPAAGCQLGSLGVGAKDASLWCKGMDNYPYSLAYGSRTWVKHTAMGTNFGNSMIVQDANNVYTLQSAGCPSPDLGIFKFVNNAWVRQGTGCLSQMGAGRDFMAGVSRSSSFPNQLWYSTNGGVNWTYWSANWKNISVVSSLNSCATDTAGHMHQVGLTTDVQLPDIPSGTVGACIAVPASPAILAWTTTGAVYSMDFSSFTWKAVTSPHINQIVGVTKNTIFGLDTGHQPYYWNVYAPSTTVTINGAWSGGCPGPGQQCNPSTTHTIKVQGMYTSGHGVNAAAGMQSQQIQWSSNANVSSWDANPNCNLVYGDPSDPECAFSTGGDYHCNQSGASLGGPDLPPVTEGTSVDVQATVGDTDYMGPYMTGTPSVGAWHGESWDYTVGACRIGIPTCPTTIPLLVADESCTYDNAAGNQLCEAVVNGLMHEVPQLSPWVILTTYFKSSNGLRVCMSPGPPIPYAQDTILLPDCQ